MAAHAGYSVRITDSDGTRRRSEITLVPARAAPGLMQGYQGDGRPRSAARMANSILGDVVFATTRVPHLRRPLDDVFKSSDYGSAVRTRKHNAGA